jgi:hypothetical protein
MRGGSGMWGESEGEIRVEDEHEGGWLNFYHRQDPTPIQPTL